MIKSLCTHVFLGNTSTQLALAERTVHADGLTENLSAQTAAAVVTGNAEAADQTDLRLLVPPGFQVNERGLFPAFQTAEGACPRRNLLCPLYIADERIRIEVCIRAVGILVQLAHESHNFIHILWILWVSAAEPDLRRRRNALGIRPANGRKRGVFLRQM